MTDWFRGAVCLAIAIGFGVNILALIIGAFVCHIKRMEKEYTRGYSWMREKVQDLDKDMNEARLRIQELRK